LPRAPPQTAVPQASSAASHRTAATLPAPSLSLNGSAASLPASSGSVPWSLPPLPPMSFELRETLGKLEARYTSQSRADELREAQVAQLRAELGSAEAASARCSSLEVHLERTNQQWSLQLEAARTSKAAEAQHMAEEVQQQRRDLETAGERVRTELRQLQAAHDAEQSKRAALQRSLAESEHWRDDLHKSQEENRRLLTEIASLRMEGDELRQSRTDAEQQQQDLRLSQMENQQLQSTIGKLRSETDDLQHIQGENRRLQRDIQRLTRGDDELQQCQADIKHLQDALQESRAENVRLHDDLINLRSEANSAAERSVVSVTRAQELLAEMGPRKRQLQELEAWKSEHQADVSELQSQKASLEAQRDALKQRIHELLTEIDVRARQSEGDMASLDDRSRKKVADLEKERSALERQQDALRLELEKLRDGGTQRASEEKLAMWELRTKRLEERLSRAEQAEQQLPDLLRQLDELRRDRDWQRQERCRLEGRVQLLVKEAEAHGAGLPHPDGAFKRQFVDRGLLITAEARRESSTEGNGSGYHGADSSVDSEDAVEPGVCFVDLHALTGPDDGRGGPVLP